jgi:hypothetical protein
LRFLTGGVHAEQRNRVLTCVHGPLAIAVDMLAAA